MAIETEMALHRVERCVGFGNVACLFFVDEDIVSQEEAIYPLRETKVSLVLPVVQLPKLLYGVCTSGACYNDTDDWMGECFVRYHRLP